MDGLDSYKLVPNWNGVTGTVKIILDPGYPYQLKECYDNVVGEVCQFSEDIVLFPPDYVPIDVTAKCNVDIDVVNPYSETEKKEIESKIKEYTKTFIDGDVLSEYYIDGERVGDYKGLRIGEDFVPYKLGVFLANNIPELKDITFTYPTEPVTITDEEMAQSNEINIIVE